MIDEKRIDWTVHGRTFRISERRLCDHAAAVATVLRELGGEIIETRPYSRSRDLDAAIGSRVGTPAELPMPEPPRVAAPERSLPMRQIEQARLPGTAAGDPGVAALGRRL